jgi:ATP-binding cassette subfamily C protein LapB
VSIASLLAGLPLEGGRLTPVLMSRALDRAGYATSIDKRPLSRIKSIFLPVILFLKDGDACIATAREGDKWQIADHLTGKAHSITTQALAQDYAGAMLMARRSESPATSVSEMPRGDTGHWFWSVVRRLWPTYVMVFLAALLINLIALASPLFVMNVYDRVLPNKALPTLWVLASGIGLALVFDYFIKGLRNLMIDAAGKRADVLLASRIYSHVLGIEMQRRPRTTGSFASHLKEFESVREFFTSSTIASFVDMLFFGVFLSVIYLIGGMMAAVPALAAILLIVAGLIYQIPLRRVARRHAEESAQRHSLLVETIGALETVKAIRAEGHLQNAWEGLVGLTSRTVERMRWLSASLANLSGLIQQLVSVGVIIVGAYQFDEGLTTTGAIVACVMLAGRAVAPLGQFAMVLARSQQSFASLKSLNTIMQMPSERPEGREFITEPITDTHIQFQNVTFGYPDTGAAAIDGISLAIKPGERVGIIGKIGSGKTTIGRLLVKLYEPQAGAILIGGIDIRQYHPHEIRRVVGLLGQEPELFHGTVRSNILMANPRASDSQLISAARLSGVDEFAKRHPSGYEMIVSERGQSLSGGQRQAIALARLLISEPRIIYLDEPSSAMDIASERVMIENLKRSITPNQTLIVSTHRHSMLDLVDRLIVISNGKLIGDGPKEQVLESMRKQSGQKA